MWITKVYTTKSRSCFMENIVKEKNWMDYAFIWKTYLLKYVIILKHLNLSKSLYIFHKIKFTSFINYSLKLSWKKIISFL